jgi:hypothetical protein
VSRSDDVQFSPDERLKARQTLQNMKCRMGYIISSTIYVKSSYALWGIIVLSTLLMLNLILFTSRRLAIEEQDSAAIGRKKIVKVVAVVPGG